MFVKKTVGTDFESVACLWLQNKKLELLMYAPQLLSGPFEN
jgi:hypothetical protein